MGVFLICDIVVILLSYYTHALSLLSPQGLESQHLSSDLSKVPAPAVGFSCTDPVVFAERVGWGGG